MYTMIQAKNELQKEKKDKGAVAEQEQKEDVKFEELNKLKESSKLKITQCYDPLVMQGTNANNTDFMDRGNPIQDKFFKLIRANNTNARAIKPTKKEIEELKKLCE